MKNDNNPRPKKKVKVQPTSKPESAEVATAVPKRTANDKRACHQPHDKFVKCAFKNKRIAIDFFNAHLNDKGLNKEKLEKFSLSNNEHHRPFRSKLANDIVYRGEIENQNYYIVMEHQSSFDKMIVVRFLQYSAELFDEHIEQNYEGVPVILGICLYHNTHSNHTPGSNHKIDLESHLISRQRRPACWPFTVNMPNQVS